MMKRDSNWVLYIHSGNKTGLATGLNIAEGKAGRATLRAKAKPVAGPVRGFS